MPDGEQNRKDQAEKGSHHNDWTFFFFITIAAILVAAAFTWAAVKSEFFYTNKPQDGFVSDLSVPDLEQ